MRPVEFFLFAILLAVLNVSEPSSVYSWGAIGLGLVGAWASFVSFRRGVAVPAV